jgi:hypothetical protein
MLGGGEGKLNDTGKRELGEKSSPTVRVHIKIQKKGQAEWLLRRWSACPASVRH